MILQTRRQRLVFILLMVSVYLFAWKLQAALFLNYDASWLMHAAERMLAGGTYSRDFFETNPPLILYLSLPPVILSKMFAFKLALLFRAYIFLLASFSLVLCYGLLGSLFRSESSPRLAVTFFITLGVVFLILPCFDFGQRDHLLVILTLPYFLLAACRLQGENFPRSVAFGVGVMAGLGFAIKPHFLLTPLLIEGYLAWQKKNARACLRPETLALLSTVFFYVLSIFLFFPDYIYIVVPYSLRLYYSSVSQPWSALLMNGAAAYCVFPLLFYLLQFKERSHKILGSVLALGLLGFLFAYFSQRMIHYYHLIPSLSFALLLLVVEFDSMVSSLPRRWPSRCLASLLGVLLFSVPVWIFHNLYTSSQGYKKETLGKLAAFMNAHARQDRVYFFVTAGSYAFSTVDYTTTRVAPRFYFLWMAAGLANQALALGQSPQPALAERLQRDKNFLINMVADDLYQYKPRYVFVDLSEDKYRVKDKNFDYLVYFSENPKFRQQWRNYHYYTTVEEQGVYKLGVYKRAKI